MPVLSPLCSLFGKFLFTQLSLWHPKMPRTNWTDMKAYKIVLPTKSIAEHFNKIVQSMVEAIRANILQSHTLISIRDTLLPKLLSREIKVKDAEKYIGAYL